MPGIHIKGTLSCALHESDNTVGFKSCTGFFPLSHIGRNLNIVLIKQILVDPKVSCITGANSQCLDLTVYCHTGKRSLIQLVCIIIAQISFECICQINRLTAKNLDAAVCGTRRYFKDIYAFTICQRRFDGCIIIINRCLFPCNPDIRIGFIKFCDILLIKR